MINKPELSGINVQVQLMFQTKQAEIYSRIVSIPLVDYVEMDQVGFMLTCNDRKKNDSDVLESACIAAFDSIMRAYTPG